MSCAKLLTTQGKDIPCPVRMPRLKMRVVLGKGPDDRVSFVPQLGHGDENSDSTSLLYPVLQAYTILFDI
jgi:hypothetical protein